MGTMQNFIMRPYRAWLAWALIFLLASLLAACSAARLGYRNGDTLAYWWLDSYADLDAEQTPWVKQRIASLFAWHRATQLKDYAQLLKLTQTRLQRELTPADLSAYYAEFRQRALLLADRALPDLADLALSLRSEQIAHIEKKFAANSETFRKDYLRGDSGRRQQFRYEKVLAQAESWFGGFDREQAALIHHASDARPLNNDLWLAERLRRQRNLIALLRRIHAEQPDREATCGLLKAYLMASYFEPVDDMPAHQAFFAASHDGAFGLVALIVNRATPAQRAHALQKLQQWIDDFNALAT